MNSKGEFNLPRGDFRTVKGNGAGVNNSWNKREKENWGDLIGNTRKSPAHTGENR